MNNYKMLRRQKYREEIKEIELIPNAKANIRVTKLSNPSKIGSRMKLKPITYKVAKNSSYSLLNTDPKDSTCSSHKHTNCYNKNKIPIMKDDSSINNKAFNLLQNKYELKNSQIYGESVPLSHRLKKDGTEASYYFSAKKNSKLVEPCVFTFKLPTENSYNQVNKLFTSIRLLMKDDANEKSKKARTNTADTDETEPQEVHLQKPRVLRSERAERSSKPYQLIEQPLDIIQTPDQKESDNKVLMEDEWKYLKSRADEGMELLPALLTGSECKLRLAIADVMTCT